MTSVRHRAVEHPGPRAECWFINAVHDRAVDLYADGARAPALAEVGPLETAAAPDLDARAARQGRTYGLCVRWAGQPAGRALAEAAAMLRPGGSCTAVFHAGDVPGRYCLSVYRNDFSPASRASLELRHVGFGPAVDWALAPRRGTDIAIPGDYRRGRLLRGQWQQAREVIENDYRLEARVNGRAAAVLPRLPLQHEVLTVVHYVARAPSQPRALDSAEPAWLVQPLRVPAGPPAEPDVSQPAPPAGAVGGGSGAGVRAPAPEILQVPTVAAARAARVQGGRR